MILKKSKTKQKRKNKSKDSSWGKTFNDLR